MSEIDIKPPAAEPEREANGVTARHNGGPPLEEEHKPDGAKGRSETISTGRLRIARPGTAHRVT
jgi:hypothetical protein